MPPKPSPETIARLVRLHRWPPPPVKVSKEAPKDSVQLIHVERLTRAGDAATLETTEAFIDLQTMGTRFISKSSTKLVKVATGPNSLGVYAAREEKGASHGSSSPIRSCPPRRSRRTDRRKMEQLQNTANRLVAQMPSGVTSDTGCGYLRFALAAKPGGGQMATVMATAFLPPGSDPDDGGEVDESRFESEDMNEEQMKMVRADAPQAESVAARANGGGEPELQSAGDRAGPAAQRDVRVGGQGPAAALLKHPRMKHEDKTTAALEAEIAILERKKIITEEQIAIRRRELARRARSSAS